LTSRINDLAGACRDKPRRYHAAHLQRQEKRFGEQIMTELTRRHLFASAAGAAAATSLGSLAVGTPAHAAAPPAGKQVAGWYRYKVGDIEVTVVTDGANRFKPPENFVVNAKKEDVSAALRAAYFQDDMMLNPYTPIVVNTGGKLYVVDTGVGEAALTSSKGAVGQFQTNLAAAGIDAKNIDAVIITHFHGDHINGLLKADNSLAFPNAEILVPAAEQKYWMDDGEMSRAPAGRVEGHFKNVRRVFNPNVLKRVSPYEVGKEIAPGITTVATHGHSPGHNSLVLSSGTSKVFVQGDVTSVPYLFVRNPGWHVMFDQDAKMAEETRRKTYDMLVAEKMPVQGFHYPFPSLAYVEKTGSGYREVPVPWSPTI
jgi:glyoxylase-like metal-dependent hydrolase (beta-lactamase superfamily II)